jgi:hypothetical protein
MAADDVEMLPYPSKAGKGQQHGLRHRLPVISGPGGRQAAAWIVRLPAIRIILAAIVVILLTGTLSSVRPSQSRPGRGSIVLAVTNLLLRGISVSDTTTTSRARSLTTMG